MMEELNQMEQPEAPLAVADDEDGQFSPFSLIFEEDDERSRQLAKHRLWLKSIRHERPAPAHRFRVGVYIRYWNQTKYENYLAYHKKQFIDSIALCPKWELVDFYVDEGQLAPNMETAPEWGRLLVDCMAGRVDLIITQKVANVSRSMDELTLCARLLAAQEPPIGIYFISEDIFTLASYYQGDLQDPFFLPDDCIPLEEGNEGGVLVE